MKIKDIPLKKMVEYCNDRDGCKGCQFSKEVEIEMGMANVCLKFCFQ